MENTIEFDDDLYMIGLSDQYLYVRYIEYHIKNIHKVYPIQVSELDAITLLVKNYTTKFLPSRCYLKATYTDDDTSAEATLRQIVPEFWSEFYKIIGAIRTIFVVSLPLALTFMDKDISSKYLNQINEKISNMTNDEIERIYGQQVNILINNQHLSAKILDCLDEKYRYIWNCDLINNETKNLALEYLISVAITLIDWSYIRRGSSWI